MMRPALLRAAALVLLLAALVHGDDLDKGLKSIKALEIQKHQAVIASDEMEGREAGSDGGHKAALYITELLAKWGFDPGGESGTWFQPVGGEIVYGDLAEANLLRVYRDRTMKSNDLYRLNDALVPLRTCKPGVAAGEIVFAGYGITAPEYEYDDYKGLKVKDQIVLVLDHEPQEKDPASRWNGDKPTKYSEWDQKIATAEKNGAGALMIVMDPANHDEKGIPKYEELEWPGDPKKAKHGIPVVYVSAEAGESIAKAAAKGLKQTQLDIDREGKPKSWRLARPAKLSVSCKGPPGKGQKNIIAIWPGSDEKLKSEHVVVGAHYDHVGYGRFGSNGGKVGAIHNGADDNGSGTCTLLEIAEALTLLKPKRSIALMWFDAEEKGMLGSREWTSRPTFPVASIVGMFNMDMIGRNEMKEINIGVERSGGAAKFPKFVAVLQEAERTFKVPFNWDLDSVDPTLMRRSDHWNFMQAGAPAVFFFGGFHADYHTDRDDPDRINYTKEELIGRIVFWAAVRLANMEGNLK